MSGGGSKPRLDPKLRAAFVEALSKGGTIRIAAGASRVPLRTAQRWLEKGRESLDRWAAECEELDEQAAPPDLDVYASFYLDAAEALAVRDLEWLARLQGSEEKSAAWQRYAWLLERTAPAEFALRDGVRRLEITGAGGGPIRAESEVKISAVQAILEHAGVKLVEHPVAEALPLVERKQLEAGGDADV